MSNKERKHAYNECGCCVEMQFGVALQHYQSKTSGYCSHSALAEEQYEIANAVNHYHLNGVGHESGESFGGRFAKVHSFDCDNCVRIVVQIRNELLQTIEAAYATFESTLGTFRTLIRMELQSGNGQGNH